MPFRTVLRTESLRGTDRYKLTDELVYETHKEDIVIVPEGFITDFASVPVLFRGFFPKAGKYKDAAVVHDYLYQYPRGNRKAMDALFSQAMADLKVNWFRRAIIYRAVRLGGGKTWNKYRDS
jgi:hypothetical protein